MNIPTALSNLGIIALLLCCVFFLVWIFLLGPLPYIISAAVLKIEKRGYWKAFGSAILGGLAGGIISAIITYIVSLLTGGTAALSLNNFNNVPALIGLLVSRLLLGTVIAWIISALVEIAITGGLYGVGFGKGALIWLLALVFSILIGIVLALLGFVLSLIGLLPNLSNLGNQIQQIIPGMTF